MSKITYELPNLEFWDDGYLATDESEHITLTRAEAINLASHLLQWATAQPQETE